LTITLEDGTALELKTNMEAMVSNVVCFFKSKAALEQTAEVVKPNRFKRMYPSIPAQPSGVLHQIRLDAPDDGPIRSYEEQMELVDATMPVFDSLMRCVFSSRLGLDLDSTPVVDGKPLPLNSELNFKVLTIGPRKSEERSDEKVFADYNGNCARIIDATRCSVVVDSEEQLINAASALIEQSEKPIELEGFGTVRFAIRRFKNRFIEPIFSGYQDALYTIELTFAGGVRVLCEVQLHLAALLAHKATNHKLYESVRKYFSMGPDLVERRTTLLSKIGTAESGEDLLRGVLESGDAERLEGLAELVGENMLDSQPLLVAVERRRLALVPDGAEGTEEEEVHAQAIYRLAYALWRNAVRLLHTYAFGSYEGLGILKAEAVPKATQAFEVQKRVLGDDHERTLLSKHLLANMLHMAGRSEEAEQLLLEVIDARQRVLGKEDEDTLKSQSSLGILLMQTKRMKDAEQVFREVLEVRERVLGEFHAETLKSKDTLAILFMQPVMHIRQLAEAEPLLRQTLDVWRRWLGESHGNTLKTKSLLTVVLQKTERHDEAEQLLREIIDVQRRVLGERHEFTIKAKHDLACVLRNPPKPTLYEVAGLIPTRMGRMYEAEPLWLEVLEEKERMLGTESPEVLVSKGNLAGLYALTSRMHLAEKLWQKVLEGQLQMLGEGHRDTLDTQYNLGYAFAQTGRKKKAERLWSKVLKARRQLLGEDHEETLLVKNSLMALHKAMGRRYRD
jgi:tetratricopeptide (TPR) repeat protein